MSSPVALTDFKTYLNLTANTGPGGDAELQAFLDTASDMIAFRVGNLTPTSRVETHHGGGPVIVLDQPIVTVTTVVEWIASTQYPLTEEDYASGTPTLGQYCFSVDGTRTLTRRVLGYSGQWAPGRDNIVVTYSSGFSAVPNVILSAIKELGRTLFTSQQGSRGAGSNAWSPVAAELPPRVAQLIASYDNADGYIG